MNASQKTGSRSHPTALLTAFTYSVWPMEYKRVHSNGVEVLILAEREWWQVHVIRSGSYGERLALLGLRTPKFEDAKEIGDSVARISHDCDGKCEGWKAVAVPKPSLIHFPSCCERD